MGTPDTQMYVHKHWKSELFIICILEDAKCTPAIVVIFMYLLFGAEQGVYSLFLELFHWKQWDVSNQLKLTVKLYKASL